MMYLNTVGGISITLYSGLDENIGEYKSRNEMDHVYYSALRIFLCILWVNQANRSR